MIEDIKNKKEIKFVCFYERVSTSGQEEAQTIQNQDMVLEELAKKNGYVVVKKYIDEGWSGDTLIRPALDELRQDAKKKMWDAVIVYDPDRLARRYSYQELVMDELREAGVEVIFITVSSPKNSLPFRQFLLSSHHSRLFILFTGRGAKIKTPAGIWLHFF